MIIMNNLSEVEQLAQRLEGLDNPSPLALAAATKLRVNHWQRERNEARALADKLASQDQETQYWALQQWKRRSWRSKRRMP